MKKALGRGLKDDLRSEYDLSQLKGGVRGKYFRQAVAGTNLVLIEPDLADIFPDSESVNHALRLLVDTAQATARHHTKPNKKLKRSAQGRSGRTPHSAGIS